MPVTNNLKTTLDLPVWEWLTTLPQTINNAASAMTSAQSGNGRYIYYSLTSVFYRYDTWSNVWATLLAPTYYTPVTVNTMQCQEVLGNRGRILETLGPTQFRIPYLAGGTALEGIEMRIMFGPGAQEVRKIISSSDAVSHDGGYLTSASATQIVDTTKKWEINQWLGYTCRVLTGNNQIEQRTILANNETTLFFVDVNLQQYEPWDNQGWRLTPTTAATYEIASQIVEVDTAYNVIPSAYSRFMVKTGVVWLLSSATGSPFYTFQMYDVLTNTWYQKTMNTGMFGGALGTEIQIESTSDLTGPLVTGTATAGTTRTITDSSQSWPADRYRNYSIRIIGGTGAGQDRRIVANKGDYFEVDSKWTVTPDATSQYEIYPDDNLIYFIGTGNAATLAYHMEADMWITGPYFDYGVLGNTIVKKDGDVGFGIATATRATTGVTSIAVGAGGSGYIVGDVLTISTGTNAQCYVTATDPLGAVTAVRLRRCGTGYTTGIKATTGGTGTACTVNVLTLGTIGTVTTTLSHLFKHGEFVRISGATEAAWNTGYNILGIWGQTTFDIEITATANLAATSTTTTSLLVDANETWDVNEHAGKFIMLVAGGSITPTSQIRRITSNTANTITIPAATAFTPTTGATRYIILNPASFGRDTKFQPKDQYPFGYASSGSTTTLVDSTKNWIRGTWVGHVVRIVAGTGLGAELTITANNNNTLVFATAAFTPDTTTRYEIMDAYGTATSGSTTTLVDTAKNWITNQWVGKRVRFIGGANQGVEVAITANTNNTLTFAATTAIDNTTNYVLLGIPARGAGCGLKWTYGNGNDNYIWTTTGGATAFVQRYNINNQTFDYGFMVPGLLVDTFTTNTSYAYDGEDNIYIQFSNSGSLYMLDVVKRVANLGSRIPGVNSTAYVGNRMELIRSKDGLKFLYIPQSNGTLFWRTLLFW
jgi:hypothetical protein